MITFVVTRTGVGVGSDGGLFALFDALDSERYSSPDGKSANETTAYTVTGTDDTTLAAVLRNLDISMSLTATCAAGAGGTTNTDSTRLRLLQIVGSNLVAQTSGDAISGAVGGAIGAGLGGGNGGVGGGTGGPSGLGGPRADALRLGALERPSGLGPTAKMLGGPWKSWAAVKGTGWDIDERNQHTTAGLGGLKGTQLNATVGIGRLIQPGLLVGVLGGYENFDYAVRALDGRFKGDGWTVGGYLGWALAPRLRFDLALAHTTLGYDMSAGTAAGSTDASRWLLSTGITGSYGWNELVLEPSVRLFAITEHESGYTDSLGTTQDERSFRTGKLSVGGRAIAPWRVNGAELNPYVGLYADERFSSDTAQPVLQPELALRDGLSARVTGGIGIGLGGGQRLSIDGEVGGITGAGSQSWSIGGRAAVPF